jgi:hypothetical protein
MGQAGEIDVLLIPLIMLIILFVAAAGFGYWAYSQRQDYKNNSDKKVAAAVSTARQEEGIKKDLAFAEAEKKPLTAYDGPEAYGSIHVEYPKTWSVYVNSTVTTSPQPLDAYFNPRVVPSAVDQGSVFALRVKVVQQAYAQVIGQYASYVKAKQVTVTPYSLPKVPGVVGVRVDGLIIPSKKNSGSMIIMPLRDKTIQIWTENAQMLGDFNTIILPGLSFAP